MTGHETLSLQEDNVGKPVHLVEILAVVRFGTIERFSLSKSSGFFLRNLLDWSREALG